jgi:Gpi18-like mannosyltransferase
MATIRQSPDRWEAARSRLRHPLTGVTLTVAAWSLAVQLVAGAGFRLINPKPYHGTGTLSAAWMQWDANWFRSIVTSGYNSRLSPAFDPGYPLLSRGVYEVLHPFGLGITGAMLLTNQLLVFALGGLVYLLATALTDSTEVGLRTVQCLLLFPFAYFFLAPYSECLCIACIAGFAWALKTRRYAVAAVFAAVAGATRPEGVLLAVVLVVGYFEQHQWKLRSLSLRLVAWAVVSLSGAGAYAIYLWVKFGSPTYSAHAEKIGWAVWFNLNPWPEIKQQFTTPYEYAGRVLGLPVEVFIVFPLLFAFAYLSWRVWKAYGPAMGLMCVLFILLGLTTNSLLALNRFMLALVPAFVVLGAWMVRKPWFDFAYRTFGCLLLALFLVMFTHGVWTG